MERTKEQWQAIGRVLAHGIYPGRKVRDAYGKCATVSDVVEWTVDMPAVHTTGNVCLYSALHKKYATVIDPPKSLSGKEVSVTIDGKTYAAIIK